jgi:hypothetical protein
VDDGIMVHSSPSLATNVKVLQSLFTSLRAAFLAFGLCLELAKTELFHFAAYLIRQLGKPLYKGPFPTIDLGCSPFTGSTPLKPQHHWRYLGFFFDSYLHYNFHLDTYINKAYSMARAFCILGNSSSGLDPENRRLVYNMCVWPVLTYGFQLYWHVGAQGILRLSRHIQAVQNYAAQWITGAFSTTPLAAVNRVTGLPPVNIQLDFQLWCSYLWWWNLPEAHPITYLLNHNDPAFYDTFLCRSIVQILPHHIAFLKPAKRRKVPLSPATCEPYPLCGAGILAPTMQPPG